MAKPLSRVVPAGPGYEDLEDSLGRLRQNMVSSGLVELLNQILEGGPDAAAVILSHAEKESTKRGIENLLTFLGIASSVDSRLLRGVRQGLIESARAARDPEPPSFLALARTLGDRKVRRGLAVALAMLRGLGS